MVGRDRDPHLVVGDRQVVHARPRRLGRRAATARSPRRRCGPASSASSACSSSSTTSVSSASGRRARSSRVAPGSSPAAAEGNAADAHLRTPDARRVTHGLLGAPRRVEQRRRVPHQHLARGREVTPRALRSSTRVPSADLEPADVLGDRGLREVERRGRLAEGPAHGDLTERGEELEVEHHGALCHRQQLIIGHDHAGRTMPSMNTTHPLRQRRRRRRPRPPRAARRAAGPPDRSSSPSEDGRLIAAALHPRRRGRRRPVHATAERATRARQLAAPPLRASLARCGSARIMSHAAKVPPRPLSDLG